jgi:hypothetical protein
VRAAAVSAVALICLAAAPRRVAPRAGIRLQNGQQRIRDLGSIVPVAAAFGSQAAGQLMRQGTITALQHLERLGSS